MGDSGSLFLGYTLAVFSLVGTSGASPALSPLVPALVLGLPLFDTALSMARRVAEGRAMFAPDCDHIHHRMTDLLPVRRAVWVLWSIAAVFGASAVAVASLPLWPGVAVLVGTLAAMSAVAVQLGYTRRAYQAPSLSQIQIVRERADTPAARPPLSQGDGASGTSEPVLRFRAPAAR